MRYHNFAGDPGSMGHRVGATQTFEPIELRARVGGFFEPAIRLPDGLVNYQEDV